MSSSRPQTVAQLMTLFRQQGYDGASMSEVTSATGLGKSSLYHYFPGGKAEMATAVLELLDAQLEPAFRALHDDRPLKQKVDGLLAVLNDFYDAGRLACLLERMCASVDRELFARPLKSAFVGLMKAFEGLARQAGRTSRDAQRLAEEAVVNVQGALVVAAGVGDPAVFTRALARVREKLLSAAAP